MEKTLPESTYKKRITLLSSQRDELKKKKSIIAWSRFFLMVIIITSFYYLRPFNLIFAVLTAFILVAIFFRLVMLSTRNNDKINNLNLLLEINNQEIEIAAGK